MRVENEVKLDYDDVLLRPKRSVLGSRKEVIVAREFKFKNTHWHGMPIMAANMDGVGTIEMANELDSAGMFTCLKKTYDESTLIEYFNSKIRKYTALSIGITEKDYQKLVDVHEICRGNLLFVCIDVANGYSERFVEFVKQIREEFPTLTIIAGNVVTGEMTEQLILNGADMVKVGIGPGSACTTRIQTGVGYPQLSAVMECADAAHGLGGFVVADGGCTCTGDIVKAFAGGADFVMLGGMLAGTDQGGGKVVRKAYTQDEFDVNDDGVIQDTKSWKFKEFVEFYGMSSKKANDIHFGGLKDYRTAEGRELMIPYKGDVNDIINDIQGGVRSAMTYIGAQKLKHISKCATFIRVNNQFNSSLCEK